MKSNIERIYSKKNVFDIINNKHYLLTLNPFYLVNNYIENIDEGLNNNFLFNLKDLNIMDDKDRNYSSNYDYKSNSVYSKDSNSDIFTLFHVASNDRNKKYTGIISSDGIGYGVNNGITEYYTKDINNRKLVYPVEELIAKTLIMLDKNLINNSYFTNNYTELFKSNKNIEKLLSLVDVYHDNYIDLILSYKDKFAKEKYYHNEIYGKQLKEHNRQLQELYHKINVLEYNNYATTYDILSLLVEIVKDSTLEDNYKEYIINDINNIFNNLLKKEEFSYLIDLKDDLLDKYKVKRLVK